MDSEIFMCPICLEEYSNDHLPYSLQCGHMLCEECLNKLRGNRQRINCPNDNKEIDTTDLRPSYDLVILIDSIRKQFDLAELSLKATLQEKLEREIRNNLEIEFATKYEEDLKAQKAQATEEIVQQNNKKYNRWMGKLKKRARRGESGLEHFVQNPSRRGFRNNQRYWPQ